MEDKRTQIRMRIPDSKVKYKQLLGFTIFNQYLGPGELLDISKSGAGFVIRDPINLDIPVKVKIHIPGEKLLILIGQIKWIEQDAASGRHRVGMQFSPYGHRRDYNAPNKLSRLGKLSQNFN